MGSGRSWWIIDNTVHQLHVSATLYMSTVLYITTVVWLLRSEYKHFYTHPTFFTELGSPWLEYTPVKLGPFVGSTSLLAGKKQRKLDFFFLKKDKKLKQNLPKKTTIHGVDFVVSHIHTVIHERSAHGHRSSSPYISCKTKKKR